MNRFLILSSLTLLLLTQAALGQSSAGGESQPKTLREFIDNSLDDYKVFAGADSDEAAQVLTALRWANNTRGSEDGVTLLYVYHGRPLATACVYPWQDRLEHGFSSLSRENIVARRDGQIVWQPQEPGIEYAEIPGAPAPEATRPQRLRQIKTLADRFQATLLGWKADNTDREELRLLSRPLYRYEPKEGEVIDGAVLAFVMGTDPEALLMIEAVRGAEAAKWRYAFVRRTSGELEARLDGAVVWKAQRFPVQNDPRRAYFTRGVPLPPDLVAAAGGQE